MIMSRSLHTKDKYKVHTAAYIQLQIEINDDNYMKQKKNKNQIIYAFRNAREKKATVYIVHYNTAATNATAQQSIRI